MKPYKTVQLRYCKKKKKKPIEIHSKGNMNESQTLLSLLGSAPKIFIKQAFCKFTKTDFGRFQRF